MDLRSLPRVRHHQRRIPLLSHHMSALAVVVGVIVNGAGEVLLAKRAAHQHQGGLWEFPGGKLEAGEAPIAGLWRELHEELGIAVVAAEPLIQIHHTYPDKSVLLDVFRVNQFDGVAEGREGQPLEWVKLGELDRYPLPAANRPILQALMLPRQLCISGAAATPQLWLKQFALSLQPGRVMLARPHSPEQLGWPWGELMTAALALCESHNIGENHNTRLMLHSSLLSAIAPGFHQLTSQAQETLLRQYCHGLHLTAVAAQGPVSIPAGLMLGMSCHDAQELELACALQCHYALLSPVQPTQTHPGAAALGWSEWARLSRLAKLPVFALGGVDQRHLGLAVSLGAQGVAGIGGFWSRDCP